MSQAAGSAARSCRDVCGARTHACRTTGRPRPEEVVATHRTEGVEHLSADVESRMSLALHRLRMHLRQADAAARDLRLAIPFVAGPRQFARHQNLDEPNALRTPKLGERTRRIDV